MKIDGNGKQLLIEQLITGRISRPAITYGRDGIHPTVMPNLELAENAITIPRD